MKIYKRQMDDDVLVRFYYFDLRKNKKISFLTLAKILLNMSYTRNSWLMISCMKVSEYQQNLDKIHQKQQN